MDVSLKTDEGMSDAGSSSITDISSDEEVGAVARPSGFVSIKVPDTVPANMQIDIKNDIVYKELADMATVFRCSMRNNFDTILRVEFRHCTAERNVGVQFTGGADDDVTVEEYETPMMLITRYFVCRNKPICDKGVQTIEEGMQALELGPRRSPDEILLSDSDESSTSSWSSDSYFCEHDARRGRGRLVRAHCSKSGLSPRSKRCRKCL